MRLLPQGKVSKDNSVEPNYVSEVERSIRRLVTWSPLSWLRLLFWLFLAPQILLDYKDQEGSIALVKRLDTTPDDLEAWLRKWTIYPYSIHRPPPQEFFDAVESLITTAENQGWKAVMVVAEWLIYTLSGIPIVVMLLAYLSGEVPFQVDGGWFGIVIVQFVMLIVMYLSDETSPASTRSSQRRLIAIIVKSFVINFVGVLAISGMGAIAPSERLPIMFALLSIGGIVAGITSIGLGEYSATAMSSVFLMMMVMFYSILSYRSTLLPKQQLDNTQRVIEILPFIAMIALPIILYAVIEHTIKQGLERKRAYWLSYFMLPLMVISYLGLIWLCLFDGWRQLASLN